MPALRQRLPRLLLRLAGLPLLLAAGAPAQAEQVAPAAGQRLNVVGHRLATANGQRCAKPAQFTGIQFHERSGYPLAERDTVGLGWGFGVLDLVPGSTAASAGIRRGDELVALDGQSLEDFHREGVGNTATYDRIAALVQRLDERLARGPARITLRRGGTLTEVDLAGQPACGGRTVFFDQRKLNAWSDGRYVAVTARMIELAADDDELAFVVAHEMAHNLLDHASQLADTSPLLAEFGLGSGRVKRAEIAADELAVALIAGAGLDLAAPRRLLERARLLRPFDLSLSHPGIGRRIAITDSAARRIAAMQQTLALPAGRSDPSVAFSARPLEPANGLILAGNTAFAASSPDSFR